MRNLKYIKGNIHKDDTLRALVTDTSPHEVPIIFSNDGFYENTKNINRYSKDSKRLLDIILNPQEKSYSVPYRYRITKDETSTRRLSLLHPRAQIEICDFYKEYEDLICYYNSQSSFSIRSPHKIGSNYFFTCPISEKNKYKGSSIDTLKFEKRVRNPASYFSYNGYDRLYKFFNSMNFFRLEKKYSKVWFADVSKCFDSIYTHTLLWAVKDMPISKRSTKYKTFGDCFDRLMQRQNYNETNGICIGPETSRIFSETIFQKIDQMVVLKAKFDGLEEKVDYECFRYVDDIIIFTNSDTISEKIYSYFEDALGEFNLHLNSSKLEKHTRPFQTDKSQLILRLENEFGKLEDSLFKKIETENGNYTVPTYIRNSNSVKIKFIKNVKSACAISETGYQMAPNYLISCFANSLERTIESYKDTPDEIRPSNEFYFSLIHLNLEIQFFLYTVHPAVNTSYSLAKGIVLSIRFLRELDPIRIVFFIEQLLKWTYELVDSFGNKTLKLSPEKVPVELTNIILAISDGSVEKNFTVSFIEKTILRSKSPDYFSIISFLFFVKNQRRFSTLKISIGKHLLRYFQTKADVLKYSHDLHLFLDIISCPFLTKDLRVKIVKHTYEKLTGAKISKQRCGVILHEFETEPWFTNWEKIDLLNMIRRKELSAVY